MKIWHQLIINNCDKDELDLVSEYLEESGALSISLNDKNDDPVLEPAPGTTPLWPEVVITALFAEESSAEHCRQFLLKAYPFLRIETESLPEQDWERCWMDDFKPQQFGKKLWICPSWCEPPDKQAVNLTLDPGLAFGSGTHPTTSLCLHWLDEQALNGKTLIDYGCGSGILALAALKLGARYAYAVDIDEQALTATENNRINNDIDSALISISQAEALETKVDILVANILLGPLLSLMERFMQLLKDKGQLVISGILEEQMEDLIDAYDKHFKLLDKKTIEGWGLLVLEKR